MPDRSLEPSIIENAPIGFDTGADQASDALKVAYEEIGYLSDELSQTRAELQRLRERQTVEEVRASLPKSSANKVYSFVAVYCVSVGALLTVDGIDSVGFTMHDSTVGIIAGSTAVSVIGLIGMFISGLFGGKRE